VKVIKEDIKSGNLKRIYLLYGSEQYLVNKYADAIVKAALGHPASEDEFNFTRFDENNYDIKNFIDTASTMPFLAQHRVVYLDECKVNDDADGFVGFVSSIPESAVIVMTAKSADKKTKAYKAIAKYGYACEFSEMTKEDLLGFIASELGKYGKKISRDDAEFFVENVATDLYSVINEVSKLVAYKGDDSVVTKHDIEEICVLRTENKIFDLIGHLTAGRIQNAMSVCEDLLYLKESPMKILRLLANEYMKLATVYDLKASGASIGSIAGATHMPDWLVRKKFALLVGQNREKLRKSTELIAFTEEQVKQGNLEIQTGLEIMLADLSLL